MRIIKLKSLLQNLAISLIISAIFCITGCHKKTPDAYSATEAKTNLRTDILKLTARTYNAQLALKDEAERINQQLEQRTRLLDQIFNFNYLMLPHQVLPPIIIEGRNILNLADNYSLRIADQEYRIIQPPRFVTLSPTWRDYLFMHFPVPEQPDRSLLPKTRKEKRLWDEYSKIGTAEGIEQAQQTFQLNLAKLQRDYQGMILYRKLLAMNMISEPFVAHTHLGVTGDDNNLQINDQVLRIIALPRLKKDMKKWRVPIVEIASKQNKTVKKVAKKPAVQTKKVTKN